MLTNKVAYLFFSYTREKNKLQFIGLTRMNINEKINGIINV